MKVFIFTLCFMLSCGPAWAVCAMKSLFSPFDKIDEAIHQSFVGNSNFA
jgi:hypothetical protein